MEDSCLTFEDIPVQCVVVKQVVRNQISVVQPNSGLPLPPPPIALWLHIILLGCLCTEVNSEVLVRMCSRHQSRFLGCACVEVNSGVLGGCALKSPPLPSVGITRRPLTTTNTFYTGLLPSAHRHQSLAPHWTTLDRPMILAQCRPLATANC